MAGKHWLNEIKTLSRMVYHKSGKNLEERLENFYRDQAGDYDRFREKLLPGRKTLMTRLSQQAGGRWADLGCGTGANLEYMGDAAVKQFTQIDLVDLSSSLLEQAQERLQKNQWDHVSTFKQDVCEFGEADSYDLVTFSFALTMIPNWFEAIDNAYHMLKPGGRIAVVDFYVAQKHKDGANHSALARHFWPAWFSWDNVFLSADHLPFLQSRFDEVDLHEGSHKLPYVPMGKVPYYAYIGQKP